MSRNSVRKYLSHLDDGNNHFSDKELADKAYNNERLESNTQRKLQHWDTLKNAQSELAKTGVEDL